MKIYRNIDDFTKPSNCVVTIGTFDGVHLGHQKVLKTLKKQAKDGEAETVLLTFWPHPRMVIHSEDHSLKLLNTIEERIDLFQKTDIDHLIIYPFTKSFSRLSSQQFITEILVNKIGVKKIIIGHDHHFGHNRTGNYHDLKILSEELGYEVFKISEQLIKQITISSTRIRSALQIGNIETANEYLGYSYFFSGKVIHGDKKGASICYPTANIEIKDSFKLIPSNGVYAVKAGFDSQTFKGMMNIGYRPTVDGINHSIEVHIFNFSGNLYGKQLKIECVGYLREEKKFSNLETLKDQLKKDEINARKVLGI